MCGYGCGIVWDVGGGGVWDVGRCVGGVRVCMCLLGSLSC